MAVTRRAISCLIAIKYSQSQSNREPQQEVLETMSASSLRLESALTGRNNMAGEVDQPCLDQIYRFGYYIMSVILQNMTVVEILACERLSRGRQEGVQDWIVTFSNRAQLQAPWSSVTINSLCSGSRLT